MDETSQKKLEQVEQSVRSHTKKRDRSASEERLLEAAEEVFAKLGFKGATTRMIADKAKVNESLIGRYFDGKMGLLISLIEKHVETEKYPMCELGYPPQATVRAELTKFIEAMYSKHCQKDKEFFKIVLSQSLTDPKFLKRLRNIIPKKMNPLLHERLLELQKKGKFAHDVDVDTYMQTLDTYFHGAMLFDKILMGAEEGEVDKMLHFVIDIYVRAVERP
ncbi:TetR/AcrR family transcriptional regulator [Bdellovibrio sp. NC01]|uniref:TetR/AcrR family transcriptional regulator n=1 Tax=Bdellovibrio sp. NC01 TaxID=2220073 RepID=UPI0011590AA9|nr:helix-turn-helix domain-containing protein [Bdellovibrio sp. NC01]QDK38890.1 TetR/AcrR family transcriptional regulator [Bdellovibrio sp. NC01]